jgi:hypothetical protein
MQAVAVSGVRIARGGITNKCESEVSDAQDRVLTNRKHCGSIVSSSQPSVIRFPTQFAWLAGGRFSLPRLQVPFGITALIGYSERSQRAPLDKMHADLHSRLGQACELGGLRNRYSLQRHMHERQSLVLRSAR